MVPSTLSLSYNITFKSVKKIEEANLTMTKYNKNADVDYVEVIKTKDPAQTHPLNRKKILEAINNQLELLGVQFTPYTLSQNTKFTSDTFGLYVKNNDIRTNSVYCYEHVLGKRTEYTYSTSLIEKIITDICNDPDIFVKYKNKKN